MGCSEYPSSLALPPIPRLRPFNDGYSRFVSALGLPPCLETSCRHPVKLSNLPR